MNKRRLLKLAELLEKDARRKRGVKFNMDTWGRVTDPKKPLSCGTQACALGLAALSGAFKRAGLGYRLDDCRVIITGKGRDRDEFIIASNIFGVTQTQARDLFVTDSGATEGAGVELAKAKQIRNFVKTGTLKDFI